MNAQGVPSFSPPHTHPFPEAEPTGASGFRGRPAHLPQKPADGHVKVTLTRRSAELIDSLVDVWETNVSSTIRRCLDMLCTPVVAAVNAEKKEITVTFTIPLHNEVTDFDVIGCWREAHAADDDDAE